MYTPPDRRRDNPSSRMTRRRRSIVTELPLQPPAKTPPPVRIRPAIEAAWRAELASTMAALHPLLDDDQAPTQQTRPLRNGPQASESPARLVSEAPPRPLSEPGSPPPVLAIEPIVDLRPRTARAGIALAGLAVVAVLISAGIAFFSQNVDVDIQADIAEPEPVVSQPAPVVTGLPVEGSNAGGALTPPVAAPERAEAPERREKPTKKNHTASNRDPKPEPKAEPFVERIVEEPGFFTVDAHPYATVYVDDDRVGDTPLIRHTLSAGKHRVKLVSSTGGTSRFVIRIEPGATLRRRVARLGDTLTLPTR